MNEPAGDDDPQVVLEQTLLKTEEVFVYKIPPMMTSGGHHADDWDLANPIATCSLHVLRRDSSLLIKLLSDKPKPNAPPGATMKHLFAQSKITIDLSSNAESKLKMEHWIESVTDSSRYFVIRISDENTGREAHIGMGFRERNDALNFKMSLQDYGNMMRKEGIVSDSLIPDETECNDKDELSTSSSQDNGNDVASSSIDAMGTLSLKEGEKIHINLKGKPSKPRVKKITQNCAGKPPMLLRKPPPPASTSGASSNFVIDTGALNITNNTDNVHQRLHTCSSSVAAVAETIENDEDEWGDFESGPTFSS
mmetsp:Transcript_16987/g.19637  ORF Transcript_16987/g.19637 Transcript_16987/m.19637 type:complete len:309 (+) Transcript_16987:114-1040(+)